MHDLKDVAIMIASSGMIGYVLPIVIGMVNKATVSKNIRIIVAVVSSVIVGLVLAMSTGELDGADATLSIGIVLAASQRAYETYWKPRWDKANSETSPQAEAK